MKKTTIATVKSFIRKNANNAYINVKSSFDGMTDCVESISGGFVPLRKSTHNGAFVSDHNSNPTLGFDGIWFVGGSRDWVSAYEDNSMIGYAVSNSCGKWIIATKKGV